MSTRPSTTSPGHAALLVGGLLLAQGCWSSITGGEESDAGSPDSDTSTSAGGDSDSDADSDVAVERVEQVAYLKASDPGLEDQFGWRMAVSGDTVAVSALYEDTGGVDSGAVYVFRRDGDSWVQEAFLKDPEYSGNGQFGMGLDLEGDILAVGSVMQPTGQGAVYLFRRSVKSWEEDGVLRGSNVETGPAFGFDVALDGEALAVGEISGKGAAYVFREGATGWYEEARVEAPHGAEGDMFGSAVDMDGDTLAVSAPFEDGGAFDAGAVYVFRREGASWNQEARLVASPSEADENLGWRWRVSLEEDTLAVGSYKRGGQGAVWIYRLVDGDWGGGTMLRAALTDPDDGFGSGVALSDGLLAVGAFGESSSATGVGGDPLDNSLSSSGAVYLFRLSSTGWREVTYLKASNTGEGDHFGGIEVSLDQGLLAVGARLEDSSAAGVDGDQDDNSTRNSGAVYLFEIE